MPQQLYVLILEDCPSDAELMVRELRAAGFEVDARRVETEADFAAQLDAAPDVILADYSLPQFDVLAALFLLHERNLDIPFIVVTGSASEEAAVECMRQGASDYLLKDRLARLAPAVTRALEQKRLRDEKRRAEEMSQSLAHRLFEAQERERRAIASELHDEIGQALTAAKINLQTHLQACQNGTHHGELNDSVALIEHILQQVRNLSLDLRPSVLDDFGLVAALRWYVKRLGERTNVETQFDADAIEPRPAPMVETALFRIAQAALTNSVRHAHAMRIIVTLRAARDIELTIRDDGVGFDVTDAFERARHGASIGLLGMRERAMLIGGKLEIESAPQRGTTVRVRVPLERAR